MPIGSASSAVAAMQEHLWDTVEELTMLQGVLFKRIEKSTEVKAISNRPARIAFEVATGGKFRVGNFDNADMGRGSAPQLAYGNLSAVAFLHATEYTALSEYATDSTEKAVENFVTLTNRQISERVAGFFDSLIANSDGSNMISQVVSVTAGNNGLVVPNADAYQDDQDLDLWTNYSDSGGALLGSVTIQSIDIANNTLWTTGAVPGGVGAGTMCFVSGSSAASNSGVFGIPYYHVSGNTGNFMGIPRSSYAGKFSTPSVTPGTTLTPTGPITPANVRAMLAQIDLAMGIDASDDEVVMHCNVDVAGAWENNAVQVQSIILNQVKGDEMPDVMKRRQTSSIGGRAVLRNVRAIPQRLDALNLKHWFRMETKAIGPYEVGGQTVFPTYGGTGGLNSTMLSYVVAMFQIGLGQPRRECYMPSISAQKGYFGN